MDNVAWGGAGKLAPVTYKLANPEWEDPSPVHIPFSVTLVTQTWDGGIVSSCTYSSQLFINVLNSRMFCTAGDLMLLEVTIAFAALMR
jgi:hypothetical protein